MGDDNKRTLGMLIAAVTEYDSFSVRARPVWIEGEEGIRGISDSDYVDTRPLDLASIETRIYGHEDKTGRRVYDFWHMEYRDVYSVDLDRARKMAATLATIERRLERLNNRFGPPESFASYVIRLAQVIGVRVFACQRDPRHRRADGFEHTITRDAGQAAYAIRRMIAEWIEQGKAA